MIGEKLPQEMRTTGVLLSSLNNCNLALGKTRGDLGSMLATRREAAECDVVFVLGRVVVDSGRLQLRGVEVEGRGL